MGNHVDISYGVDFKRARERLDRATGKIFREYWKAKKGNGSDKEIEWLRQVYREAQREMEALSPRDEAAIKAALEQRI